MLALIIDDSRAMRRVLRRIVEPLGFSVIEAEHGQDGLNQLAQHNHDVDLILVDWNMPVMDGLTFVKTLRVWKWRREQLLSAVERNTWLPSSHHSGCTLATGNECDFTPWVVSPESSGTSSGKLRP